MADLGSRSALTGQDLRSLFRSGSVAGLDDPQLLARFLGGRDDVAERAFAALVERHGRSVLRACREVLADPHEAEDAAQAVFLVLARRAGSIRDAEALACWLFGVAVRVSRQMRQASARRRVREASFAENAPTGREEPGEDAVSRAETAAQLYEELDGLPERYRRPLILCHLEGLTHQQAAERLGCPARTVHTRLNRGKARLRERLIRRGLAPATVAALTTFTASTSNAAVSTLWVESTARTALGFLAGSSTTPSALVAGGVLSTMTFSKIKAAGIIGGIACAVLFGAMPLAFRPQAAPPKPTAPRAFVDAKPDDKTSAKQAEIVVLDAETGKPIEGASVDVTIDYHDTMRKTDANGVVKVDLSKQRISWMFGADIWADGYVQQRLSTGEKKPENATSPMRHEFRLHKGNETVRARSGRRRQADRRCRGGLR